MITVTIDGRELKVPRLTDNAKPCCSGTVRAECDGMNCNECAYNYLWELNDNEND